nr:lysine-rich arabinogalactan protein 19-like [Lolium perenne]
MAPSFRPPPRPSVPPIGSTSPPATSPSKESTGEGRNRRPRLLLLRGRPSSPWPPWRLPASSGLSEPSVALVVSLRCSGAPQFPLSPSVAPPPHAPAPAAARPRRRRRSGDLLLAAPPPPGSPRRPLANAPFRASRGPRERRLRRSPAPVTVGLTTGG